MRRALACCVLALALPAAPAVRAQSADDEAALGELERFLNDPDARRENAAGSPDAAAVEDWLQRYPAWAQKELVAIALEIMRESGAGAQKHVDSYRQGGAEAAGASFSPAVRARIAALEARLERDPSFNSSQNLSRMREEIPGFLAQPAR